jgi:hypothetical protein
VPLPGDTSQADTADALAAAVQRLGATEIVLLLGRDVPETLRDAALALDVPVDALPLEPGMPVPAAMAPRLRRVLLSTRSAHAMLRDAPCVPAVMLPRPVQRSALTRGSLGDAMGILPADSSPATFAFIRDLARALQLRGSSRSLIVFGGAFRDVGLLRLGNVFVTGPLEDDDWEEAFAAHPCGGLILTLREPRFAHASFELARRAGLPFACYPFGGAVDLLADTPDGLALDPAWTADQLALVTDTFLSASALSGFGLPTAEVA